ADVAIGELWILAEIAGKRRNQQVVHTADDHHFDRLRIALLASEIREAIGVCDRHLLVERAVKDEQRLAKILDRLGGIEYQKALKPRCVGGSPLVCRDPLPSFA